MIAFAPAAARADELERTVIDFLANTFLKAGCSDNAKFRLGLWQFDQGKIPISERGGRRIYDELTALLMRKLPVEKWHDVVGEPTFAAAILDRLVHNAYRIALDGPSLRKTGTDHDWARR